MKQIIIMVAILSSTVTFSKSYFVKLKSHQSLVNLTQSKNWNADVHALRTVDTKIAPFAVIDSSLNKNQLKNELIDKGLDVSYVESNDIDYKLFDSSPVDTMYSSQWGLNGKHGIESERAWSTQKGSKDLVVAVIDSGIDYSHPDLKSNLWINQAELNGKAGVDDDGNGYIDDINGINAFAKNGNPMDDMGHGTHCAGVIGASHNSIGIAGVMANVKLMAVKIFTGAGKTSVEAIVKGIEYAIDNKAKIMSNSWGGTQSSQAISDAVKAAGEAGILFVAAAGNGNMFGFGYNIDKKPVYPAGYDMDHILSVGSIASTGKRSMFSNYGQKSVDIFAPGSKVQSTYKDKTYKSLSGTSMATPHVSGVAGLVASEFPRADAIELKERILEGALKKSSFTNKSVSGGVLNAPGALGL